MKNLNDKNKIFVDTNVLVGSFIQDATHEDEKRCWKYLCSVTGKRIYVSSLSVAQLVSVLQKKMPNSEIVRHVKTILSKAIVIDFTEKDIVASLHIDGHDLEDNMQYVLSQKMKCGIIITQNKKDYVNYLNIDVIKAKEHRSINQ